MTYSNEYGYQYQDISELKLETRNDFSVDELRDVISSGKELGVDYDYPYKPGTDDNGYSLTEKNLHGQNLYLGLDYNNPKGFRLIEIEDFQYEGATIQGFGTFTSITQGNLGDGHDAWALFRHEESGRLFMNTGYYSSWGSGEMDDWCEVVEAEVKVVRYKDIKTGVIFDNPAATV